ncbi:hypothetical protein BCR43DRAFT_524015 [Syncephalastrum racemosum]|uniref:Protein Lines N-terminal domain-containing protein n=1 Tax=Syncephalastrum racemosum TaxID=13706 RepID=A0A1X2HG70_SYNRA|nr:hypothetical protein BCR43DRAFT_524015 [Syncephalastrum racemosum]
MPNWAEKNLLIHRLTGSNDLKRTTLREWPWNTAFQGDVFANDLDVQVILGCMDSTFACEDQSIWLQKSVNFIVSKLPEECGCYLDIFHALLKRHRKTPNAVGQALLNTFAHHPLLSHWVSSGLDHENVSFLVLLIDLVKAKQDYAKEALLSYHQKVLHLWYASHITVVRRSIELVLRLLKQGSFPPASALHGLYHFMDYLAQSLTLEQLHILLAPDRTEFYHDPVIPSIIIDRECLKLLSQAFLSSLLLPHAQIPADIVEHISQRIHVFRQELTEMDILDLIFQLHANNDDDAVNLQLDVLTLHGSHTNAQVSGLLDAMGLEPHRLFLFFCYRSGMDHSLLVDFLLSSETEFLFFFLRYLKHAAAHPEKLVRVCNKLGDETDGEIDIYDIYGMMQRIVPVLKAGGFPYNPAPLIHRLEQVLKYLEPYLS